MTLEKYFSQVQVVEQPNEASKLVVTEKNLVRDTPKILCDWPSECDKKVDGLCTHDKYCSQKGDWVGR